MKKSTVLIVANQDTPDKMVSALAESASQERIHITFLLLGMMPALPGYAYGATPYGGMSLPENWAELTDEARKTQSERVQQVEAILADSGASGDVQSVLSATLDIKHLVASRARVCDMVHIAPNLRDTPDLMREAIYGTLFQSPAGLILNGTPSLQAKRIFIAWDSSKPASTAAHVALPYLKDAEEVVIGCFDPVVSQEQDGADPGVDLASWLSHHGCKVTVTQYPSGGIEIGQCIHDRAKEIGADLVVLGAYGHARMIEAVFGGTTRTMIAQTDLPVLLAH
jgi:nucleotide-binding universal stress UspA family protein